jgi:decaprenylphospho-beta-D-ribofuranose 2-oxidase
MKQTLSGFGRTQFITTHTLRPEYLFDLQSIVKNTQTPVLARGCGNSYGDEALTPDTTILLERLNRFVSFDAEKMQLVCESGVTLYDIQHTFLPKNIGLIISPGTALVSIGGAIANDVHGKNHDRVGSFSKSVIWLDLLLSNGDMMRCSRTENSQIFFATVGGLGLTGVITTVCLQLQAQSNTVVVSNEFIATIPALLSRLRAIRDQANYSVAWIDLVTKHFGRSILSTAEPQSQQANVCIKKDNDTFSSFISRLFVRIPIFLNRYTIQLFNHLYYFLRFKKSHRFTQSLSEFLYPLDALPHWNYLYGKQGLYQFQCVIPDDYAESGIAEILDTVRQSKHRCYLGIIKTLGSDGEGLLSFTQRGFTIALDFPNKKNIRKLLHTLEMITLKYHGRVYLAKDACLTPESFSIMYPKISEFRAILKSIHSNTQSTMAKRLGITE